MYYAFLIIKIFVGMYESEILTVLFVVGVGVVAIIID
jgi:hypothetical protein